ncbi:hypothetical protein OPV22_011384 [Ensete ventricosum]|uniref:DUF4005 domain-containing protein n=1 Tax=Ensete ventricosum TaxID=4639 RepID=A0AAV8RIY3_ENSVE|nr:hypothetical protein OPV22_011384 [Ensete ventricosum]
MAVLSQSQENTSRWAPRTRRSRDKTEEQGFLLPSPRRHQPSRLALRDSASTSRSGLIPIPDEPAVPPVQKRTDRAGSRVGQARPPAHDAPSPELSAPGPTFPHSRALNTAN